MNPQHCHNSNNNSNKTSKPTKTMAEMAITKTALLMKMFVAKVTVAMIVATTIMDRTTMMAAMVTAAATTAAMMIVAPTEHLQNHKTKQMKQMKVIQSKSEFERILLCCLSPCRYNDLFRLVRQLFCYKTESSLKAINHHNTINCGIACQYLF